MLGTRRHDHMMPRLLVTELLRRDRGRIDYSTIMGISLGL